MMPAFEWQVRRRVVEQQEARAGSLHLSERGQVQLDQKVSALVPRRVTRWVAALDTLHAALLDLICRYEGDWQAGDVHGEGTFTDARGWSFTGGFDKDRPTRGVLAEADGTVHIVTYSKGCERIWNGPSPATKVHLQLQDLTYRTPVRTHARQDPLQPNAWVLFISPHRVRQASPISRLQPPQNAAAEFLMTC